MTKDTQSMTSLWRSNWQEHGDGGGGWRNISSLFGFSGARSLRVIALHGGMVGGMVADCSTALNPAQWPASPITTPRCKEPALLLCCSAAIAITFSFGHYRSFLVKIGESRTHTPHPAPFVSHKKACDPLNVCLISAPSDPNTPPPLS